MLAIKRILHGFSYNDCYMKKTDCFTIGSITLLLLICIFISFFLKTLDIYKKIKIHAWYLNVGTVSFNQLVLFSLFIVSALIQGCISLNEYMFSILYFLPSNLRSKTSQNRINKLVHTEELLLVFLHCWKKWYTESNKSNELNGFVLEGMSNLLLIKNQKFTCHF